MDALTHEQRVVAEEIAWVEIRVAGETVGFFDPATATPGERAAFARFIATAKTGAPDAR